MIQVFGALFMASTQSGSGLLPEVEAFLAGSPLTSLVGGRDLAGSTGQTMQTLDPGSGRPIAEFHLLSADDVDRAVQAAAHAFKASGWAMMAPNERGVHLHRLADAVERQKKIIGQIEALDAGKLLAHAEGEVQNFVDTLRYFTDMAQHVQRRNVLAVAGHEAWTVRHPWGPCGFIFPWNFPFLLVGWGISPALAAGNTVVVKPAEDTPLSAIYLGRLAREAGIPDGVINIVVGTGQVAGAALSGHPGIKRMSFTGSPEVGRLVGEACGRNLVPAKLELGGKGAAVVFEDVDVPQIAQKLVHAITFHCGQVCCDATRWLVHESIARQFIDECAGRMEAVKVGYQLAGGTAMGPVVNARQRERVLSYLRKGQEQGAEMVVPGGPASVPGHDGFYLKPALLSGSLDNIAARDEIFGPVAYIATFATEDEAVAMANDTEYGLANSVWTTDIGRAGRVAESMVAGNSWINAHNVFLRGVPYGGVNKSGMGGGVNSIETLFDYWRSQSVVRQL
jgi:acyl-CoA reductase-like NAD-dependent aldehyde dehydrogenase